LVDS
jgi:ribosomal protein L25 (general stress protein Ctc)